MLHGLQMNHNSSTLHLAEIHATEEIRAAATTDTFSSVIEMETAVPSRAFFISLSEGAGYIFFKERDAAACISVYFWMIQRCKICI